MVGISRISGVLQQRWDAADTAVRAHLLRHKRKYALLGFLLLVVPPDKIAEWAWSTLPTATDLLSVTTMDLSNIPVSWWNLITAPVGLLLLLLVWKESRRANQKSGTEPSDHERSTTTDSQSPPEQEKPELSVYFTTPPTVRFEDGVMRIFFHVVVGNSGARSFASAWGVFLHRAGAPEPESLPILGDTDRTYQLQPAPGVFIAIRPIDLIPKRASTIPIEKGFAVEGWVVVAAPGYTEQALLGSALIVTVQDVTGRIYAVHSPRFAGAQSHSPQQK